MKVTYASKIKPYEYVTMIGGPGWKKAPMQAIDAIRKGDKFFIKVGQKEVFIRVVSMNDKYILRTEPDGLKSNNLDNLPECG